MIWQLHKKENSENTDTLNQKKLKGWTQDYNKKSEIVPLGGKLQPLKNSFRDFLKVLLSSRFFQLIF